MSNIKTICGTVVLEIKQNENTIQTIHATNVITRVGFDNMLKSTHGVSFNVNNIAFGKGTDEPNINNTILTEVSDKFLNTGFESLPDNELGIRMLFKVPQNSSIDNITYTEIGLFDNTNNLMSRLLLSDPLNKKPNQEITIKWDYFTGAVTGNSKTAYVTIERFHCALLYNNFVDGRYPLKTTIQEPKWYNLRELVIDHYEDQEGNVVTFPFTVKQETMIVPIFETKFKKDSYQNTIRDLDNVYCVRCTDPKHLCLFNVENGVGISNTANGHIFYSPEVLSEEHTDYKINANATIVNKKDTSFVKEKSFILLNKSYFKKQNPSFKRKFQSLYVAIQNKSIYENETYITNRVSLNLEFEGQWYVYFMYNNKMVDELLQNNFNLPFVVENNYMFNKRSYVIVADASVTQENYLRVQQHLTNNQFFKIPDARHEQSINLGRIPSYLEIAKKINTTNVKRNSIWFSAPSTWNFKVEIQVSIVDDYIHHTSIDLCGRMLGIRFYALPLYFVEEYIRRDSISGTQGITTFYTNSGQYKEEYLFKLLNTFKGWGNEFVVLQVMTSYHLHAHSFYEDVPPSVQTDRGNNTSKDFHDIWAYHNLAVLEEYYRISVFPDATMKFREWIENNRVKLNAWLFKEGQAHFATVSQSGMQAAMIFKSIPTSPFKGVGKRLVVVDSAYSDEATLLTTKKIAFNVPALFKPEQLKKIDITNNFAGFTYARSADDISKVVDHTLPAVIVDETKQNTPNIIQYSETDCLLTVILD